MSRISSGAKDLVSKVLFGCGLTNPRRFGFGLLNVATFHRVLPEDLRRAYPLPSLAVTPEELAWFLNFFGRNFTCGSLRDIATRWIEGETPKRPFLALTFDDGQVDNFVYGKPVLDRADMKASFFVLPRAIEQNETLWPDRLGYAVNKLSVRDSSQIKLLARDLGVTLEVGDKNALPGRMFVRSAKGIGREERIDWVNRTEKMVGGLARPDWDGMMTWDQLALLAKEGHEIGSHSMTHSILPQLSTEEIEREVAQSRSDLESRLGIAIDSFCYPNGDHDIRTVAAVRGAGYVRAVTTRWGLNATSESIFKLRRCDMTNEELATYDGSLSGSLLAWRMSGQYPGLRS